MKGPRGWQCPKCWKAGRVIKVEVRGRIVEQQPRLIVAPGGSPTGPSHFYKVRYRVCEHPNCGNNIVTEERPRHDIKKVPPAKENKLPQKKRANKPGK